MTQGERNQTEPRHLPKLKREKPDVKAKMQNLLGTVWSWGHCIENELQKRVQNPWVFSWIAICNGDKEKLPGKKTITKELEATILKAHMLLGIIKFPTRHDKSTVHSL